MTANSIQIVTDSAGDLPPELAEQHDITVVPLSVNLEGETFQDGDRDPEQFLRDMREASELPKTSQPSPGEYYKVFQELGQRGPIICLCLSSELSGTVRSAEMAANMVESEVVVFDTLAATLAQGVQAVRAAEMVEEGADLDSIVSHLQWLREHQRIFIAIPDLTNLVRGGRLSRWRGKLADLMQLRPILHNVQGAIEPYERVRGTEQMFARIPELVREETCRIEERTIGISYAGNRDRAEWMAEQLSILNPRDIVIGPMYSVISTYTGDNAMVVGA